MSHVKGPTIMQTAPRSPPAQKSRVAFADRIAEPSAPSGHSHDDTIMYRKATTTSSRPPLSSNNTTPTSTRRSSSSSIDHPNVSSARSDMPTGVPKRPSMKTTLKPWRSVGANLNRRSAPPTVRFLDPEPSPRKLTGPGKTMSLKAPSTESAPVRPAYSRGVSTPNLGPHQYRQKNITIGTLTRPPLLSPASRHASAVGYSGASANSSRTLSPVQLQNDRTSGPVTHLRQRVNKRFSTPAVPSQVGPRPDPRWSGIPLPAGFVPPGRPTTPIRTTSYHSVVSGLSSSPPSSVTAAHAPSQYDPLQNYIPCMAAMCTAHYTPAHSGPTYYAAQKPFHLFKHHSYCPRHASKEMQEANSLCKKEYESMRQNAGRKTLGVVAQDFEIFLQLYREARHAEDARLQKAQSQRVLGSSSLLVSNGKVVRDDGLDWRYTLRKCTRKGCTAASYSPFSTQYFGFYNTPNPSTSLLPLPTLCPSCSKADSEGFGAKLMEKWSSRCGWDGEEWDGWYQNALQARKAEQAFWEKAQERVVLEKLAKKAKKAKASLNATKDGVEEAAAQVQMQVKKAEGESEAEVTPKKVKRKSVFKRMFRRSETTGAVAVAAAAA